MRDLRSIERNGPVRLNRSWSQLGAVIRAGLAVCVLFQAEAWAQATLYLSPADDGSPSVVPAVIAEGGSGSVFLYLKSQGSASSDPQSICASGEGGEVCGVSLALDATGTLTFSGFVPEPSADLFFSLSPTQLRINVLDSVAPSIGVHRYGEVQLQAAGESCAPGACVVTLDENEIVEADLQVSSVNLLTSSNVIATVPEPESTLVLAIGFAVLVAMAAAKAKEDPPEGSRPTL